MKSYIDATSTCSLISITDFYKLLYPDAPADIETSVSKVMITSHFSDTLKELQTENNEILLNSLQRATENLIKCDVTEHNLNNPSTILLSNNLKLTYRFLSSDILVLDCMS